MRPGIVQKIFKDHFRHYRRTRKLSNREMRAVGSIMTCRTPFQGYHVVACPNGDYRQRLYNSCKHRNCPQCGAAETELWLERRRRQALDCRYFHIIFTISHDLHPIWRWNRRLFTDRMLRSAWHSLRELLADTGWLGAQPGAIGVFQSWDDELAEHCHLHFIVTAGGLTPDGEWLDVNGEFLLPAPVLAAKFRGKFLAGLREGFCALTPRGKTKPATQQLVPPAGMNRRQCLNLLNKVGRQRWNVRIEPPYNHAQGVFTYVGRYIRRGPVSEKRITGYEGQIVHIAYAHPEKHSAKEFCLSAEVFMQRLLQHVPAKGTHLVRSYGLFHPNCHEKLDAARRQLEQPPHEPLPETPSALSLIRQMVPDMPGTRCPHCGSKLRTILIRRRGRAPDWRRAA